MKRLFVLTLMVMIVGLPSTIALSEDAYSVSSHNYTQATTIDEQFLLRGDGYSVQLLSLELVTSQDGSEYLRANVWVHNTTDYELEIATDDLKINGVELYGGGMRNCGTGDYLWNFEIWSEDGYTPEQREAIHNPQTLTVTMDVYEGYNWEHLMTQTVQIELNGLKKQ